MATTDEVKEHWGVEFSIVSQGLAEDEVVSFVDSLMDQADKERQEQDRQASLLKLAEQTVIEADKLADGIKQQARQEADEEGASIRAAAEEAAKEQAQRIVKKSQRDAASQSSATIAKADKEAQEVVAKARNDAEAIIGPVREKVSSMEAEAKLEAEYIVRRFTVKFVEELRSVITDTSNKMLPSLDDLMKESGHGSILEDEKDSKRAISSSGGKGKGSSKEE